MGGEAFGGPGVDEEGRAAGAGVGGDSRAGPEVPQHKELPAAVLTGSCFS